MRLNGLAITYKDGLNIINIRDKYYTYHAGELLCRIFQGDTLYNISQIARTSINYCPMKDNMLTQDEIEEAERYILTALLYDDFTPAQLLAQGSFIRCIESYRALDSTATIQLLTQEIERTEDDDRLFSEIGFKTIGDFLRLCYNNYIIDLLNGIDVFSTTSAVWSNTATDKEKLHYEELCSALNNYDSIPGTTLETTFDDLTGAFDHRYIINSFLAMAVFEFSHLTDTVAKITRCQNPECRRFFIAKRSSAKYCGFSAPQSPKRACNDYYPQLVHREKLRTNELDRLIKNAKGRLYNAKRRHPEHTREIDGLLSNLTINAPNKKDQVLDGTITVSDFRKWLDSHKKEEDES